MPSESAADDYGDDETSAGNMLDSGQRQRTDLHEQTGMTDGIRVAAEHCDGRTWNSGWWLGVFFIFLVSAIWAASSILVQLITDDLDFDRPFAITYIGSSLFVGYIPSYVLMSSFGWIRSAPLREPGVDTVDSSEGVYKELDTDEEYATAGGTATNNTSVNGARDDDNVLDNQPPAPADFTRLDGSRAALGQKGDEIVTTNVVITSSAPISKRVGLRSHMFTFKLGLLLAPVWFLAQWTYITSLADTSVTSSTIISNSSALFTFIFNVMAKTEKFTLTKAIGVALAMAGAVAVGLGDRGGGEESVLGDLAALVSAVAYGVYSTVLRKVAPSDDAVAMPLVLGYMGAANTVLFLPVLVTLTLAPGVRALQGLTLNIMKLVVVKALLDNVLSELLWARAILLTTPTVATVGCSLTIPIAFLTDFALHGKYPNVLAIIGAFLVVGGFAFVSRGEPSSPRDIEADQRDENDDDSRSSWGLGAASRRRQQGYLRRTWSNGSPASSTSA